MGRALDESGAPLPGVTVVMEANGGRIAASTGPDGSFRISGVPSAQVTLTASLAGFQSRNVSFLYDQRPRQVDFVMHIGDATEQVAVSAGGAAPPAAAARKMDQPSQNVINLQRRAAGVLPVRVDVPRAGTSHRFVKPLVVDEEAEVHLRYRRR